MNNSRSIMIHNEWMFANRSLDFSQFVADQFPTVRWYEDSADSIGHYHECPTYDIQVVLYTWQRLGHDPIFCAVKRRPRPHGYTVIPANDNYEALAMIGRVREIEAEIMDIFDDDEPSDEDINRWYELVAEKRETQRRAVELSARWI